MNDWRLEDAFAPVPDVVSEHIDKALAETQAMNGKHRRPMLKVVLVTALVLALAGTAIAAGIRWGMLDFLSQGHRVGDTLPEAREAIQTSVPQRGGVLEGVTFTLREALCDSQYAWMVFDVTSGEKDTLLLANGTSAHAPASELQPELPEDMTIAQWAEKNGYARITMARLAQETNTQDEFAIERMSWHWQPDGTVSIIVMGPYTRQETGDLHFVCQTMPWWSNGAEQHAAQKTLMTVTLEPGAPLWTAEWSGEAAIPDSRIVIEHVELIGTVAGMYSRITYAEPYNVRSKGIWIGEWLRLLDDQGRELMLGAGTGLYNVQLGGETHGLNKPVGDGRFQQTETYAALPEPPDILRIDATRFAHDQQEKIGFVEIPMK